MEKTAVLLTMSVAVASAACAFDWPADPVSCKALERSDTGHAADTSAFKVDSYWSGATLPGATEDGWVGSGLTISAPSDGTKFSGRSLTLEGRLDANITKVTNIDWLRLMGGAHVYFKNVSCGIKGSEVRVDAPRENPAVLELGRFLGFSTNPSMAPLTSDATAMLVVESMRTPCLQPVLSSWNLSGFYGTLRIDRTETSLTEAPDVGATNTVTGSVTLPGRLELGNGVVLVKSGETGRIVSGSLSLEAGSEILLSAGNENFLTVTSRLEIAEGVLFRNGMATGAATDYTPYRRLVAIKAGVQTVLPDLLTIAYAGSDTNCNYLGEIAPGMGVFDDPDAPGDKMLAYRRGRPVNRLLVESPADLFENDANWSAGHVPTPAENAVWAKHGTLAAELGDYACPFGGVILENTRRLVIACKSVSVGNLFMNTDGQIRFSSAPASTGETRYGMQMHRLTCRHVGIYGNGTSGGIVSTSNGRLLLIDAPIFGDGRLRLDVPSNGTSYTYGGLELVRVNDGFSGRTELVAKNLNCDTATGKRPRLYVSDSRNLGGPMPTETYDGIKLADDGILVGTRSLVFEQANRGLCIENRARIVMRDPQSDTFEIRVPFTLGGELVFGNDCPNAQYANTGAGSGTLVLSSPVRFTDGTVVSDVPTAASNRITMVVGKIRPTVTNALDGVALAFGAESSGIELDRNVSAEMREYGFLAVKDGSSLAADGEIPVAIMGIAPDETRFEQAVCTVATGESRRIRDLLVLQKPHGFSAELACVDRDDGTTTIKAVCERGGFVLIYR